MSTLQRGSLLESQNTMYTRIALNVSNSTAFSGTIKISIKIPLRMPLNRWLSPNKFIWWPDSGRTSWRAFWNRNRKDSRTAARSCFCSGILFEIRCFALDWERGVHCRTCRRYSEQHLWRPRGFPSRFSEIFSTKTSDFEDLESFPNFGKVFVRLLVTSDNPKVRKFNSPFRMR